MAKRSGRKRKSVVVKHSRERPIVPGDKDPQLLITEILNKEFSAVPMRQRPTIADVYKSAYGCGYKNHDRKCKNCIRKYYYIVNKKEFKELLVDARKERLPDFALTLEARLGLLSDIALDTSNETSDRIKAIETVEKLIGNKLEQPGVNINIQQNSQVAPTVLNILQQKYKENE